MGIGPSNECQSPRCREPEGSRCYKHSHNYSWWCKYCKKEDDDQKQSQQQREREQEQRFKYYEQERIKKQIEEKERDIREQERILQEKIKWGKY